MNENSVKNNGLNHGDPVKKGDYLGRIETDENEDGDSSGPHVHHENWSRMVKAGGILLIQDQKIRWVKGERKQHPTANILKMHLSICGEKA